jgi:hypothetical protein
MEIASTLISHLTCPRYVSMHKFAQITVGGYMGFHRLLLRTIVPRLYLLNLDATHSLVLGQVSKILVALVVCQWEQRIDWWCFPCLKIKDTRTSLVQWNHNNRFPSNGARKLVDTCGGTQRQNPQAHVYRSSFHPEYYWVLYPQENVCFV